jgi:hypothetical protein
VQTEIDPEVAPPAAPRSHPHRRRRLIILAVVVALVAAGAGVFWSRWSNRAPGPASFSDALAKFRTDDPVGGATSSTVPTPGVYTYKGFGSEKLSLLSTVQKQGPKLPGTVTRTSPGCWTFKIGYNAHHWQSWDMCRRGDGLVERGGTTRQQFNFVAFTVDDVAKFTCRPEGVRIDPSLKPGERVRQSCAGHDSANGASTTSSGWNRYVRIEPIRIAGRTVHAVRYHQTRKIAGDQTGRTTEDLWYDVKTFMLLRERRVIVVDSPAPAPLHKVTYTERGGFELASFTPER